MPRQKFRIVIEIDSDVGTGVADEPYLTPEKVSHQLNKHLGFFQLTKGLPCHGTAAAKIVGCVEDTPTEGEN